MTPEEIVNTLYPVIDACTCDKCKRKALRLIRKAVTQAYDDAARYIELHVLPKANAKAIAAAIRALKP